MGVRVPNEGATMRTQTEEHEESVKFAEQFILGFLVLAKHKKTAVNFFAQNYVTVYSHLPVGTAPAFSSGFFASHSRYACVFSM